VIAFRHCDPRWPFLRTDAAQPGARWHALGEGPVNYFADTPVGAWAEFLRHEEITDVVDLVGVRRSLWAVEIPDSGYGRPDLPEPTLRGGRSTYAACQAEAARLRSAGHRGLQAPSAALLPKGAAGWECVPNEFPAGAREGHVYAVFGAPTGLVGWPAVEAGQPPARILPSVNQFAGT
jgi:hypothetical protein